MLLKRALEHVSGERRCSASFQSYPVRHRRAFRRGIADAFTDNSRSNVAFEKRLAEIQSAGDDALAPLNLDIRTAIMTVLGALREIAHCEAAICWRSAA